LGRFVDYYAVLDVPRNATQKEISKAYKRLTKVFDPEINEDMFRLVNEAYQVLSDPAKRAEYDARYDAISQAQEELTEPEEALAPSARRSWSTCSDYLTSMSSRSSQTIAPRPSTRRGARPLGLR
jgi:curved DNA-binding protein CbpA